MDRSHGFQALFMMSKIISKGSEAKNMHFEIRSDIPAYLSELKIWLNEVRGIELEAMDDFFTARVDEYEDHMALLENAGFQKVAAIDCINGATLIKAVRR